MAENKDKPKLEWVRSPQGVFEFYSNVIHLTWSFDDVRVRLARITPSSETLTPGRPFISVAEERAAISLSWRNAKVLSIELAKLIQSYEKANGEINVRPKLAEAPDAPSTEPPAEEPSVQ